MKREYIVDDIVEYFECVTKKIPDDGFSDNRWFRGHGDPHFQLRPSFLRLDLPYAREETLCAEFHIHYSDLIQSKIHTAFEQYALMQHYQVSTRLLDWSLSPLVALFFALENPHHRTSSGGHVWVVDPHILNENSGHGQLVVVPNEFASSSLRNYLPKYLRDNKQEGIPDGIACLQIPDRNARQSSQFGAFSIHGFNHNSIENILTQADAFSCAKIEFTSKFCKEHAYKTLSDVGINRQTVYRDLQHLGERIMEEYGQA